MEFELNSIIPKHQNSLCKKEKSEETLQMINSQKINLIFDQSERATDIIRFCRAKGLKSSSQDTIQKNSKRIIRASSTRQDNEDKKVQNFPRIKLNRISQLTSEQTASKQIDFGNLISLLNLQDDHFFKQKNSKRDPIINQKITGSEQEMIFPCQDLRPLQIQKNCLLQRTIDIMSNKNEKVAIPIHEGLYKANTPHKIDLNQSEIPNLCNFFLKKTYSQSIKFIEDYKSGYGPIQMQSKNKDEQQQGALNYQTPKGNKDKSRSHFIRKQQSSLTLPRTCGVSYIKQTESTQQQPFKPLPPLIFQGSSTCFLRQGSHETSLDASKRSLIKNFIMNIQSFWLPFIITDEDNMRDLLLGQKPQNAKIGWVQGIQNLWPLFVEGVFLLILISPKSLQTEDEVWNSLFKKQNCFKIGILAKKSTSGAKAFLKSIKGDDDDITVMTSLQHKFSSAESKILNFSESKMDIDHKDSPQEEKKISGTFDILEQELKSSRTVITMSLRLQMYVEENEWKQIFTRQQKQLLNQIILMTKEKLEKKSIRIITDRIELGKYVDKLNYYGKKIPTLRMRSQQMNAKIDVQSQINSKIHNQFKFTAQMFSSFNPVFSPQFIQSTHICSPADLLSNTQQEAWKKSLKFPLYYITTRDSFAFDLIEKHTKLRRAVNGKQYTRVDYYFYPDNLPTNYGQQYKKLFPNLEVGITSYHDFFTEQELKEYEANVFDLENRAFKNQFLQMTVQPSIVSTKIKRTKFFFNYRYMWTRCQLSQPFSTVGAGVRKDVTPPPEWTKTIEQQMVKQQIVEKDFLNSVAINVYHDGKEGLAQHFDDAVRFKQPIYTLRLFSDARLSFGSQFYGFCNGAFIIPLPRGCICVMAESSYAANGVKHCVRPCDMTGKSAAVILRQMHHQVVSQSSKYDEYIDFPAWLSCFSDDPKSITYAEQKRLQSEAIMK